MPLLVKIIIAIILLIILAVAVLLFMVWDAHMRAENEFIKAVCYRDEDKEK